MKIDSDRQRSTLLNVPGATLRIKFPPLIAFRCTSHFQKSIIATRATKLLDARVSLLISLEIAESLGKKRTGAFRGGINREFLGKPA